MFAGTTSKSPLLNGDTSSKQHVISEGVKTDVRKSPPDDDEPQLEAMSNLQIKVVHRVLDSEERYNEANSRRGLGDVLT